MRRFEPFPRWGWVLLIVTAVVAPFAWRYSVSDVIAPDGVNCGSALFGRGAQSDVVAGPSCARLVSDAQPLAVLFGIVAIVLILASVTTLVVRGFLPREPDTPD